MCNLLSRQRRYSERRIASPTSTWRSQRRVKSKWLMNSQQFITQYKWGWKKAMIGLRARLEHSTKMSQRKWFSGFRQIEELLRSCSIWISFKAALTLHESELSNEISSRFVSTFRKLSTNELMQKHINKSRLAMSELNEKLLLFFIEFCNFSHMHNDVSTRLALRWKPDTDR